VASSEFDFDVLFVLFSVRRVDLCILCPDKCLEEVSRKGLGFIEGTLQIFVEFFCEGVTVIDPEDSFENVQVDCNVEIFPLIVVSQFSDDLGDLLPFEEDSLRNACILDFLLGDVDALVGEIVVDLYGPDPVVFESCFDDMLLEVGIVPEYLAIVFEPGGLYSRDVVVFGCFSCFHEGEVIDGGAHLVEEMFVDILFEVLSFFLD